MSMDFEQHAATANQFVRLVSEELGVSLKMAGKIIRAVFHALRNRISHEESFHLMAQLPMALKGVYADGWKFNTDYLHIGVVNDFIEEIKQEDGRLSGYDFSDPLKGGTAIAIVFKALNYLITDEEMNDIISVMSPALKIFIKEKMIGEGIVL